MDVAVNTWAVVLCAVLSMGLGVVWYGPLFGKVWAKLEGFPEDAAEKAKNDPVAMRRMYWGYAIQFVASLIAMFMLASVIALAGAYLVLGGVGLGLLAGVAVWAGFVAPATLGMVLWEGKPFKLWAIVSGFWLALFALAGIVLSVWR